MTSFFLFPGIDVATSILCHDLTLSAFTTFLCRNLDLMSRHHFYCQPLCFLCSFFLKLRHLLVVLSLQAGRDSTLLVCLFSCHKVVIKLRPSSFFNQCNSCRDLKSMSRLDCSSFLLKYMSRPQFHVATSFLLLAILIFVTTTLFRPFNKFYVATSFLLSATNYWSQLLFYVAT